MALISFAGMCQNLIKRLGALQFCSWSRETNKAGVDMPGVIMAYHFQWKTLEQYCPGSEIQVCFNSQSGSPEYFLPQGLVITGKNKQSNKKLQALYGYHWKAKASSRCCFFSPNNCIFSLHRKPSLLIWSRRKAEAGFYNEICWQLKTLKRKKGLTRNIFESTF